MRRFLAVVALALLAPIAAAQTPGLPPAGSLDGLGVNIHFTHPRDGEMQMLADAGFKWVRMDFAWSAIEKTKGKYDFSDYESLLKALDQHHMRAILILDYSNRMYDDGQSPHTDAGREAFSKWAAASAAHFKGRGVIWEMYNEPNIKFWKPKPNVDDYAKLALAVGKAIRQAAPDELYVGPATSLIDMKFLEACFKAGCLQYWDAVSVHPYRQKAPETVVPEYQKLRALIDQYAPSGKKIPILSGEWGYSSSWRNFDESRQGQYLPRELLTNVASGVLVSIWYDWHDDGQDPKEAEHHFGTVHFPYRPDQAQVYEPKPAYEAMKTLTSELLGMTFSKRIPGKSDADWILLFHGPAGDKLVAWTTDKDHEVTVEGKAVMLSGTPKYWNK